jgi:hypothetical protein
LKAITLTSEVVNKVNRSAKFSAYEKSGKIKIDLSNGFERSGIDLTKTFSIQGFGRYIEASQPAKIDPLTLYTNLVPPPPPPPPPSPL